MLCRQIVSEEHPWKVPVPLPQMVPHVGAERNSNSTSEQHHWLWILQVGFSAAVLHGHLLVCAAEMVLLLWVLFSCPGLGL